MRNIIFAVAVLVLAASGVFARAAELEGIQWTLTYANGQRVTAGSAYFEIEAGGRRFTGNTGCNRMFGGVDVSGQRIAFSDIGMTKRMCKLAEGSIPENVFVDAMKRSARFTQKANDLTIFDRRGRTVLRFVRLVKQPPVEVAPPAAARLDNRKWELESIKNRKTFAPIRGVFVNFDGARNAVGGDSGCNSFGGQFRVNSSRISITKLVHTMRACVEDGKMNVEREFLEGLQAANRYEIRDGRLFLYRGQTLQLTLRGVAKN